jgi:hypothetical protein
LERLVQDCILKYTEGNMADEKNRDQNQGNERNEKAMGATARAGAQPDQKGQPGQQRQPEQGQSGQQNFGRGEQEAAGQGGGIQGQGQRNPSQGQDKGGEDFRPTGSGARQGDGDV